MYSYTPTHKFLVLAPIQSGPLSVAADQPELASQASSTRERSSSQSSTTSTGSPLGAVSPLPSGFLYLGHDAVIEILRRKKAVLHVDRDMAFFD
ncbi:hypothetical protein P170DRAFT_476894 [Aspergillus steynii IBT 23096]|uniref:Uncharacterized protein n=1 Tax=Aspergillus steynii IBT 23096 TaxID=1392250 RepID=A0A2I2G5X1_9EURO|nr:uncharacterized protein P170DRAFT_476894 [Aspergillus steynii IBT 23096]PLB48270.1 hypothetical protein P170DRAFT_476894 [Aspergillus steynii IBT 23096]